MEKNTKILLGLAVAGVVAYLFLKPKKESQTSQEWQKLLKNDFCATDPNSYECYVQKGGGFMPIKRTTIYVMTQQEMEACNEDPRNCKM